MICGLVGWVLGFMKFFDIVCKIVLMGILFFVRFYCCVIKFFKGFVSKKWLGIIFLGKRFWFFRGIESGGSRV